MAKSGGKSSGTSGTVSVGTAYAAPNAKTVMNGAMSSGKGGKGAASAPVMRGGKSKFKKGSSRGR